MKVLNHRLFTSDNEPMPFETSPNYSKGRTLSQDYIVIHYTAGSSATGSVKWLCNPQAKASAHAVISRTGDITQLVNFNKVAWHAGASAWDNKKYLNSYSIGIELDNAGLLSYQGGEWRSWFGKAIDESEVVIAKHKNRDTEMGWHTYTQAQIESCRELCTVLVDKYPIKEILGHEDIAPERKTDPGPAFPMNNIQSIVMGREADEEQLPIRKTITTLNIRTGPGTQYSKLEEGPLPPDTEVLVINKINNWHLVEVLDILNGNADIQGWVHGAYLTED